MNPILRGGVAACAAVLAGCTTISTRTLSDAGATPLHFLEFLIQDAIRAVALYNDGIKVTIPNPARYAIHKLIIAQERSIGVAKRDKDLAQASALIGILHANDPYLLHDTWEEARARGPKWRTNIERSMKMLSLTEKDLAS